MLRAGVDSMDREHILCSAEPIERGPDTMGPLNRSFAGARAVEARSLALPGGTVDLGRLAAGVVDDVSTVARRHTAGLRIRGRVGVRGIRSGSGRS